MESVITVENFTTKLSSLSQDKGNPLHAVIDMGSNGIRFSISDLSAPRSRVLHCVYRERAGISLYDALHEASPEASPFHFPEHTIRQITETLARFKTICDGYLVPQSQISVFATEAMRTAKNRDEMLSAIFEETGLSVDLMSPAMESLFGAMGARSGFYHVDGMFMDLGGGSVQMTYVDSNVSGDYHISAATAATSMPFGAARLTEALNDTLRAQRTTQDLHARMRDDFSQLLSTTPRLREQIKHEEGITIYFCGGGFRGYGSMLMHTDPVNPYPISAIGGYVATGERFTQCEAMLRANEAPGKIHGMSKRRRQQFPAIVKVVQALVSAVPKIKQVVFCSGGNREGVLFMKLPPEIRESNPLSLLPGNNSSQHPEVITAIARIVQSVLPDLYPTTFSQELLIYIVRNTWNNTGTLTDVNSATALHAPISGHLASLPGLDHPKSAVLALTLCTRWGTDLSPLDRSLYTQLQLIAGPDLAWYSIYIGTLTSLLATVIPVLPSDVAKIAEIVSLSISLLDAMDNQNKDRRLKLQIKVAERAKRGVDMETLVSAFERIESKVERSVRWKVVAEIGEMDDR